MAFTLTNPFNVTDAGNLELDGARHVATAVVGGITYLFATGSDDSGVSVFSMAVDGTLTNLFNVPDNGTLRLSGAFGVATAVVDDTTYLIASGLNDSGLSVFRVGADGSLTNTDNVGDTVALQLGSAVDVVTAVVGGTTYVFAAGNTDHGISVFSLGTNGTLTNVDNVNDVESGAFRLSGVQGMTTAVVGGTTYLFAAGFHDSGVSVFSVSTDGVLTNAFNVGDNATLELGGAVGVTTAVVGGTTYLFVAGFGDDGVSVFSVGTNGTLTNVDNVTDAGALELDNAIYLTTAVVGGTTYLFVTGSDDDGMSVFSVGTDGHLTNVTNVVDNATLELDRAYRPTTVTVGGNTYVVVPGQHDDGLSVFRVFDDSNTAPSADAVGPVNGTEDSGVRIAITLSGNDADPADAVESFTIATLAANGQLFDAATGGNLLGAGSIVAATGSGPWTATVYFQPNADFNGATNFTYSAFDGVANSTAATASITVTAETDTVTDALTTSEGVAVTANVLTGANGASQDGFEGTPLLTNATNGANGTVTFDAAGNVTYTPDADFFGTDTFTYTVTSGGVTETGIVNVTVTEVNDAPTASDDGLSAVDEDSGTRIIAIADLIGNDVKGPANEAAQALDIISVGNAVGGTVQIVGANIEFTLDPNFNGAASFDYTVEDNGTSNGGADPLTDGGHVSFAVNPVNDAPSFTPGANQTVAEDAGAQTVLGWATNISAGPADEASQILQFGVTNDNNALFSVQPFISDDGTLTYTPAANASGTATLSVTLADSGGGLVTEQFTITVTEANDAPTAVDDDLSPVNEDSSTRVIPIADLIGNDLDGPANEAGQALDIISVGSAVGGTVQINGGNIEFTLDPNFNGTASFDYTVQDNGTTNGASDPRTDVGSVSFAVNPVNDAPSFVVGVDPVVNEDGGNVFSIGATSILAGPPNESGQSLSFNVTLTGTTGNLAFTAMPAIDPLTGTLTFTAAANTNGSATFEVTLVDDGSGVPPNQNASATQSFTIVVNAVNDAPQFSDLNNVLNNLEGAGPTELEEDAELSDIELDAADNYAGAVLTLQRQGGANPDDVFGANGTLSFAGTDVLVGAIIVGTLAANAAGVLTITFNANATAELVDDVLQQITYQNTSDAPQAQFTIAYTFSDGNAGAQGSGGTGIASGGVMVNIGAVNDDPAATGVPSDVTVTENVASNLDLSAITLSDPDSGANAITLTLAASAGVLAAASGGGVTVGGSGTGTLTLVGAVANIDAFLNVASNIQYTTALDAAGDNVATLTLTANDGGNSGTGGGGNVTLGTVNIDSDGVNDDPAASGVPSDVTVTEDAASNLDLSAITLTDPDSGANAITLTLAASAGILAAASGGGVTVGGSGTGTLTLTGVVANIDAFLNTVSNIQYTTALNAAGDNVATLAFTANDGGNSGTGGGGNVALGTVNVDATAVNDQTGGTIASGTIAYVENQAPTQLDVSLTVSDPDDTHLEGAIVWITGNFATGQDVLGFVNQNGITGNYDAGTGLLTLTGTATLAQYQQALRSVTYFNSSDTPTTIARTVHFEVGDGNGLADFGDVGVNLTGVNDSPVLANVPATTAYRRGEPAVVLAAGATVADLDTPTIDQATVTITDVQLGDLLAADTTGTAITATYNAGNGILTLTGPDTLANYQQVLASVSFATTGPNATRTLAWQLDDGDAAGNLSTVVNSIINLAGTTLNDFDGDARSDILWRDDAGVLVLWEMDGPNVTGNHVVNGTPPASRVLDIADFNGDGQNDVLWQEGAGVLVLREMNGPTITHTAALALTPLPAYWHYEGTGDFSGDGRSDILWRDDAGVLVLWEMDGPNVTGNHAVGNLGTDWHVAEIADFNGDSRSDILWRHDDGTVRLWEMYGPNIIGDTNLGTFANYWQIADSGDYNGDGNSDLLWRDSAGILVMWEMDGPNVIGNTLVDTVPATMQVVNSGDYDGDGNADILWRDGTTVLLWRMDGPNVINETNVATIPTYWHIQ